MTFNIAPFYLVVNNTSPGPWVEIGTLFLVKSKFHWLAAPCTSQFLDLCRVMRFYFRGPPAAKSAAKNVYEVGN